MFHVRTRLMGPAHFLAATAASVLVLSSSLAQEPEGRVSVAAAVGQPAPPPVLNPRHPETYVVQRGDTLWGIAAMFLRDPWYWPEIWQINPQVENPHLIFPGDLLSLAYLDDGRPVVQVERGPAVAFTGGGGGVERLSPRIREQPLEEAISTIPYETLASFLSRSVVLDKEQLDELPYVVAHREGLISSTGRDTYARLVEKPVGAVYNLVHLGDELVDPDDGSVLGYQGIFIGQGEVTRSGDPATVHVLESTRETLVGDYLVEEEDVRPVNFFPHSPPVDLQGQIISVMDGVSLIGQYQVVVLNRGAEHGLDQGTVLRVFKTGAVVRDKVRGRGGFGEKVRLPDEPAGTMMVFRTFDRMSYGLIMEATTPISVFDTVRNP
jgi:LysM domain-containing protein